MPRTEPPVDRVRRIAATLSDVEEGTTHGNPAWKTGGKLFAWFPRKKEVEEGTLALRMSIEDRDARAAAKPAAYYVTPHYHDYPVVLVRPWELTDAALAREMREAHALIAGAPERRSARGSTKKRR
jgi:hypothetical protein